MDKEELKSWVRAFLSALKIVGGLASVVSLMVLANYLFGPVGFIMAGATFTLAFITWAIKDTQ